MVLLLFLLLLPYPTPILISNYLLFFKNSLRIHRNAENFCEYDLFQWPPIKRIKLASSVLLHDFHTPNFKKTYNATLWGDCRANILGGFSTFFI